MNDDHTLEVDRIGPLISWSKPNGWNSSLIVLRTFLEGKIIEYHLDSNDFSNVYQEALKKSEYHGHVEKDQEENEDFFGINNKNSTPKKMIKPKLLGPKSKRKSVNSQDSDEDYSPKKKSKLLGIQDSDEGKKIQA